MFCSYFCSCCGILPLLMWLLGTKSCSCILNYTSCCGLPARVPFLPPFVLVCQPGLVYLSCRLVNRYIVFIGLSTHSLPDELSLSPVFLTPCLSAPSIPPYFNIIVCLEPFESTGRCCTKLALSTLPAAGTPGFRSIAPIGCACTCPLPPPIEPLVPKDFLRWRKPTAHMTHTQSRQ